MSNSLASLLSAAFAKVRARVTPSRTPQQESAARFAQGIINGPRRQSKSVPKVGSPDPAPAAQSAEQQLEQVLFALGMRPADLATADAVGVHTAVRERLARRVSDEAIEQVAALGFPVNALPRQASGDGTQMEIGIEEFRAMTPEAKMSFSQRGGRIV